MTLSPEIGDILHQDRVARASQPEVDPAPEPEPVAEVEPVPELIVEGQPEQPEQPQEPTVETPTASLPQPQLPAASEEIVYPSDYDATHTDARKWLDNCIQQALYFDASDLLIKTSSPQSDIQGGNAGMTMTADMRIDGKMRPLSKVVGENVNVAMNIFKSGSNLATNGSFKPQETTYKIMVDGEERNGRVVLFRKADGGDAVVIRLPLKGEAPRLHELGLSDDSQRLMTELLSQSNKMLIVAGPMGEGKTTLAHAALLHVARGTDTVWTVEDPVERTLPGLIQLEVDKTNDASFEDLLPYLVRADYNTLFLGEIRDKVTAVTGVRQAKAGRQVITTIHANDNMTALLRLIELAEDTPLSVLDSVRGVVSQRLVGRLNPHWDGHLAIDKYKGRIPVNEVLLVTDELTEAVMSNSSLTEIKKIALEGSQSNFTVECQRLIDEGVTDKAEIVRVFGE